MKSPIYLFFCTVSPIYLEYIPKTLFLSYNDCAMEQILGGAVQLFKMTSQETKNLSNFFSGDYINGLKNFPLYCNNYVDSNPIYFQHKSNIKNESWRKRD